MKFWITRIIISGLIAFNMVNLNFANSQMVKAVVAVTGSIKDEVTKKPISVNIVVMDNTGKKINSAKSNAFEDGYYFITGLIPGNNYTFNIISDKYLNEVLNISIPNSDKYIEISRDFNLKPLEINAKIPLTVSPFEYNKYKLRFGSAVSLEKLASTLKNNPKVKFTILSYPDNNQSPEINSNITKQRADALMDYLVIQGIDPLRIKIQGSASTDPDFPPPTEKRAKGKKYIGTTYIVINDIL